MRRRIALPALVLMVSAIATVAPASAGVLAYRASDGSADPAFVKLGAFTTVERVVPDGAGGDYLIGSISVNGGQRKMVHLRADGSVDPAFRPVIHGGRVVAAALRGSQIAVAGTFTAIGSRPRAGLAVLAAGSGRALAWRPVVPGNASSHDWGGVAFAGSTLVASTEEGISAWRPGESGAAWTATLGGDRPAGIVVWQGSVMALFTDLNTGAGTLVRLGAGNGRRRATGLDGSVVRSLQSVGGRLVALLNGGGVIVLGDRAASRRLASCSEASGSASGFFVSFAGDAGTLYIAEANFSGRQSGSPEVSGPGVTACPLDGGTTAFAPAPLAHGYSDPLAHAVALVGNHVLLFTKHL